MKIIEPGNLHSSWSHEVTCTFDGLPRPVQERLRNQKSSR